MSESNSTASFLIESLLDDTIKKEPESSSTNITHTESSLSSDRERFGAQKPNNQYNHKLYHSQSYNDRLHYKLPEHRISDEFAPIHSHSIDPHPPRPHYNGNRYYHWGHSKQTYPQNIYSYYSNGAHSRNYYDYVKRNPVSQSYISSTRTMDLVVDNHRHYSSMVPTKSAPNYKFVDNEAEAPKKVVLSEESYLKLIESYRLSEELRSNAIFKKKRKQRTIFTKQQTELLESVFTQNEYITLDERASLAKQLKISEKQVKIWFQNRRNKLKKINTSLNTTDLDPEKTLSSEDSEEGEECNMVLSVNRQED